MSQLRGLQPGFLFLHSPPQAIDESELAQLALLARSEGFELGLCSPRNNALTKLALAPPGSVKCYQLHLDQLIDADASGIASLAQMNLWVHGIYSPTRESKLPKLRAREEYCAAISRQHHSIKFVIGCKSVKGLARLVAFDQMLGQ